MSRKRRSLIRPLTSPLELDAPAPVSDEPAEPSFDPFATDSEAADPGPPPEPPVAPPPPEAPVAAAPTPPPESPEPLDEELPVPVPPRSPSAFPSIPPVLAEPPAEEPVATPEAGMAPVTIPVIDAPYTDEVDNDDAYAAMERDAPPTEEHPLSIARAVHGAHYDAAYTVPQVPETLRRFDAVVGSESFAGTVDPDPSTSDGSLPDVRFDPGRGPRRVAAFPWMAIGAVVLFAVGVLVVSFTVGPIPLAPSDDPGEALAPLPDAPPAPPLEPAPVAEPTPPPPVVPEAAAEPGTLRIRSNKKVSVYINGDYVGMTPETRDVPAGAYEISVVQPGHPDTRQTQQIDVEAGRTRSVRFRF